MSTQTIRMRKRISGGFLPNNFPCLLFYNYNQYKATCIYTTVFVRARDHLNKCTALSQDEAAKNLFIRMQPAQCHVLLPGNLIKLLQVNSAQSI